MSIDSCRYMKTCTRTGAPWLCSCRAWARQHSPSSLSCPRRMANRSGGVFGIFGYLIWVKCTNLLLLGFGNAWSKIGLSGNFKRGEGEGFLVHTLLLALRNGNQCCGSMTFWYGSGSADPYLWLMDPDPDPAILVDLQNINKKLILTKVFCLLLFYIIFQRKKSKKEVKKQLHSRFFVLFVLDERRSGSGSRRPQNIRIRRIRNTVGNKTLFVWYLQPTRCRGSE